MELIGFIQVFNIIVIAIAIAIGTLLYMCCRSLTFFPSSSSAVDSAVADCAAVADDEDADIPPRREKYDVFISFRGDDTRLGITSHLHAALLQKKIQTYIDNRLKRGEEIRPALLEAIEKSTISVIIFSQNYADSTWCLDELVHILKCNNREGRMVIPVFYDINPSHVRKQHGSYADAFAQLEKRFDSSIDKVQKWRDALTTAANLSGFDHSNKSGTEADLIQRETPNVEVIFANCSEIQERPLKHADFKKMSNLIMLSLFGQLTSSLDLPDSLRYLNWLKYPLESLPSNFCPENLVELHMHNSKVKKLWKEEQILVNLQVIDLSYSDYLTEVPNLSGSLKIVHINLCGCGSLVEIPWYFQHLHKLTHLRLGRCTSLKYLPEMPGNIQYLDLKYSGIKELPESVWSNENISYLNISHCTDLDKLPNNRCELKVSDVLGIESCTSLGKFSELPRDISKLSLFGFTRLVSLPTNICKLKHLEELNLSGCSKLENFPKILEPMEHLKSLNLSATAVKELPSSIEFLPALKRVQLQGCKWLSSIPKSICKLKCLEELNLSGCSTLKNFPEILEPMEHLKSLNLSATTVKKLPSSIEFLPALKRVQLQGCKRLSSIPKSICKLKCLEELDISGCCMLRNFPEILEPMENLKSLNLSRTAVEQLYTSSIEFLPALKNIELEGCNKLSCISKSMLKYVKRPDLKVMESSDESETNESDDHGEYLRKDLFGETGALEESDGFIGTNLAIAVQIGSSEMRIEEIHIR
ncbi:hypothetical protein DVH24_010171 [Malus domestica]|uniref:TIR domain-containing protein n=1 Tax=Malus domestica TaxID=3750 RepID=A0A498JS26_MALDO|nr:hypothetical protein DVH24_010171 [Malus domestica]